MEIRDVGMMMMILPSREKRPKLYLLFTPSLFLMRIQANSFSFKFPTLACDNIVLLFPCNPRDQEGFTQCFHQMVDRDPSAKNYALLGEAYLRILNPETAVEALEAAYKLDSTNSRLR